MKTKILAELKKKFPGLPTEFLGFIASKLEAKVTEESQIEGAITELDNTLPIKDQADFFQQESDRRVTAARQKFEADNKKDDSNNKKDDKSDDKKDDSKNDISAQFKELSDRLSAYEKREAQAKLSESFHKKLIEKKIPVKFAKGRVIETEDQLETVLAEVESDYEEVKQELANEGLGGSKPPKGGDGKTSKLASKEEVNDVIENIM